MWGQLLALAPTLISAGKSLFGGKEAEKTDSEKNTSVADSAERYLNYLNEKKDTYNTYNAYNNSDNILPTEEDKAWTEYLAGKFGSLLGLTGLSGLFGENFGEDGDEKVATTDESGDNDGNTAKLERQVKKQRKVNEQQQAKIDELTEQVKKLEQEEQEKDKTGIKVVQRGTEAPNKEEVGEAGATRRGGDTEASAKTGEGKKTAGKTAEDFVDPNHTPIAEADKDKIFESAPSINLDDKEKTFLSHSDGKGGRMSRGQETLGALAHDIRSALSYLASLGKSPEEAFNTVFPLVMKAENELKITGLCAEAASFAKLNHGDGSPTDGSGIDRVQDLQITVEALTGKK